MSERSASSGRALGVVLLLGAALVIPGLALLSGTTGGDRSSTDRGPEGSAALAGVLRRMELPVESLRVGLTPLRLEEPGSVLFVPSSPGLLSAPGISGGELSLLKRFVAAGSTLVVVSDRRSPVLEHFGFDLDPRARPRRKASERDPDGEEALPVLLGPEAVGGSLRVEGRAAFEAAVEDEALFVTVQTPGLLGNSGSDPAFVAVRRSVGSGWVYAVSDPSTLANAGIGRGGNLEFYVRLVERQLGPEGRVLFDDLHAGGGDDHGVVAYAREAGLMPTLVLLVLLIALYLWRASCRFGTVLPAVAEQHPRASIERVEATAALYERAGLYAHGLSVLSRRFRRRLETRSGMAWDRHRLREWIDRECGGEAGVLFERIRLKLGTLLAGPEPDPGASREVVRLIHDFESRYLQRRVPRDRHS